MIQSMTAFARNECTIAEGQLICEIRSVNHRFLELTIHLPDNLRPLEMPVREQLKNILNRGKVDCFLKLKINKQKNNPSLLTLNQNALQQLAKANDIILQEFGATTLPTMIDILTYPGVLEQQELNISKLELTILQCIQETALSLTEAKKSEGKKLAALFIERFDLIKQELDKIKLVLPNIATHYQTRLQERLSEINASLDHDRLEQEMLFLSQKMDVSEEIDRTIVHIDEAKRIIQQGGVIGRRLDFILQELNRETNTLASKSIDKQTTHAAVEMKVLIEQIREQVQNVE